MTLTELVFSSINLPLTILLIVLAAYRIITMLFGLDLDFEMDFDIDVDADFDADTDTSFDVTGLDIDEISNIEVKKDAIVNNRQKKLKWWQIILIYFNFAELPFLFTFTAWIFFWWSLTVIGTYFTGSYDNSFGLVIFLAAVIPALIINKIFTTPFKAIFKKLERKGVDSLDLLGRKGILLSNISNDKLGSVKLVVNSDPINVYAKSLKGETIKLGQEVLIIKESLDKKYYYIQAY
ncbi:MAG: hypothetical protein ACI83B_002339 [Sediminicola sp.]|jgi:hypothetical protein|tara:strand:+ start:2227 stop:2934 length:708 start_codon:yes stop_codon:yes gene_type:complete